MTPFQQAAFLLLAGLTALLAGSAPAQDTTPQQPAAPIVRITPHPAAGTHPSAQTATPASRTYTPAPRTLRPKLSSATATASAPANPKASAEHKSATSALSSAGLNRNVIVLDPAHGGTDSGARIGDTTLEKNVTLALAFKLRALLVARGFDVVLTRDSDLATEPNSPSTPLTLDDRAGIANHARAAACLLLHATGRGQGVHLYSSELDAAPGESTAMPWLTAQAAWVPASQALEQQIGAALGRSQIPLLSSTASVRPVDSLTCPALVVELAPDGDDPNSVNDQEYLERVAAAIAGALVFWKDAVQPPPHLAPPPALIHVHHAAPTPATTTPAPATPEAQP